LNCNSIEELNLRLVAAKRGDALLLFDWANESKVRENALSCDKIPWGDHIVWFTNKLNESRSKIFILMANEVPVGQIRFDLVDGFWEIDYSIDKSHRGRGFGKKIIELGILEFPCSSQFRAKVKLTNFASLKIFEQVGFELLHELNTIVVYQK
jgi:UDP-2,4-diacetamido-2,4,6-trideoxy-beta-L-altropyranose hydrolase